MKRNLECLFLCMFVGALCWEASFAEDTFTAEMAVKVKRVGSVEMAPDGERIAYTLSVPRPIYAKDDGPAWSELHVVDMDGVSQPYVTGKINVGGVRWTPDGKGISFLAKRGDDEYTALYVIPVDGGEAYKVLEHEMGIGGYCWSPDEQQVAFTALPKEDKDRKEAKERGFNAEVFEEDWLLAKVWIATPNLRREGEAEDDEARQLDLEGSASTLRWSPDGRYLAVTLAPTPSIDDSYMRRKIHIVDVASGESVAQVETAGKLGQFEWDPAGERLALVAGIDKHDPAESQLMVVSAAGGAPTHILPGYPGHVEAIAWQGGDTIVFLGARGVWACLETIQADGKKRKTILDAGVYSLEGMSLSRDGKSVAFVEDSPQHPGEVFAMKLGQKAPRRLTNSNCWLDDVRLAKQEVVQFTARDGLDLEGILVRPLDEVLGQRYPLIMMVHGGPESHHKNGWLTSYSLPGQVAAAQGFAAFYTNYRGSTGRGLEFSKLSQADPAGKEFDDLVDAIDHLVETGLVDKAKVGITGRSYGGYASGWGATAYTDRYAAAVMGVGISDKLLSFALSDIPEELTLVHTIKYPWEDVDFFRERSPLTHFQKCRTPLLIMHGTSDTRVHPANSKAFYRMIKTYGQVPVRLVLHPGEPHGSQRTGSRLDYTLRLMQWMNHYLKGPGGDPPPFELDLTEYKPADGEDEE